MNCLAPEFLHKQKNALVDPHGRYITKLRLSLLDACNMRCLYCMPENPTFNHASTFASAEELLAIAKNLCWLGIKEVRITGGEPLIRKEFRQIAQGLCQLPFEKVALTTNAAYLKEHLDFFEEIGLSHINISLDSLNPANFKKMTRSGNFEATLKATTEAIERGFKVKINTVVMRGMNDHELFDFINFSQSHAVEVRFLELMKVGVMADRFDEYFVSTDELLQKICERMGVVEIPVSKDSTSLRFQLDNGAKIGFIASESKPFCGGCSRLRLGPKGELRPCLFAETGPSLRGVAVEQYPEILKGTIALKPITRPHSTGDGMFQIGG